MTIDKMTEIGTPVGEPPRPPSPLFDNTAYKNELNTRIHDYQQSTLVGEDLRQLFRNEFQDWTVDSFAKCPKVALLEIRKTLQERGVWVENIPEISHAQSLYNLIIKDKRVEWSKQEIEDYIKRGGRFISHSIKRYMLRNNMYHLLNPVAQAQIPPTMKHLIPVYRTRSPTFPVPEPMRRPLPTAEPFQGPSDNTRNLNRTPEPTVSPPELPEQAKSTYPLPENLCPLDEEKEEHREELGNKGEEGDNRKQESKGIEESITIPSENSLPSCELCLPTLPPKQYPPDPNDTPKQHKTREVINSLNKPKDQPTHKLTGRKRPPVAHDDASKNRGATIKPLPEPPLTDWPVVRSVTQPGNSPNKL